MYVTFPLHSSSSLYWIPTANIAIHIAKVPMFGKTKDFFRFLRSSGDSLPYFCFNASIFHKVFLTIEYSTGINSNIDLACRIWLWNFRPYHVVINNLTKSPSKIWILITYLLTYYSRLSNSCGPTFIYNFNFLQSLHALIR